MNKSWVREIKDLINEIEGCDYMARVKYVLYLLCLELYQAKFNQDGVPAGGSIFDPYKSFDLCRDRVREKIALMVKRADPSDLSSFIPATLYEDLLTHKEKKKLGQVYTPFDIIKKMVIGVFDLKVLDKNTRVLDPSCGGGYFLIELYRYISDACPLIPKKYILENMIYGVDIDDFSIFLSKMGLIFTSGLSDVKFNIHKGDFLLKDMEDIKFDIIIGNPPYVGHKNTDKDYKNLLYQKYFDVYYDKADISYCFFKRAEEILKSDGLISFITSRYFMEALYGDKLRNFLKNNFSIVSLVDYNGNKVFKGAMVSPALITLSKNRNKNIFTYVKIKGDLSESYEYGQDKLKDTGWIILKDEDERLFEKIHSLSNTYIRDICTIKQGIITGYDKAFIVDEEVIEKYKIEDFLLRKWIKNSNISRNSIQYNNLYLIYSDIIEDEEACPGAINYLSGYKTILMKRRECLKGFRKWYELQWGRKKDDFENPKIVFPFKASTNSFAYDDKAYFCSADIYLMNNFSKDLPLDYLLSYLNSEVFEFYLKCQAKIVGKNVFEYYPNKLNNLKIYLPQENVGQNFSHLGKFSIELLSKKVFNMNEKEVNIIKKYL